MREESPKDEPSDPDAETLESQPDQPRRSIPREIGQYKVRRLIGSGGMGTVYEAIQENPKRKVAIKVMKSGATSRSAMRRFEYESEVLGRLSHQAIAKVFEAGKWDDGTGGVPYFAMEYITGAKDIIQYAKTKDLDATKKLELFTEICDAVHHGHLKGIIHRDLKPDNILVDQTGNPKIIDFGVARATDSDLAVTTLQTNVGQLVGTVQYMSPEQCEADPDLIDARSDVYSLGVILYELLTGQPPYDLSSIPIYEATRLIREQQPTRMTTIAEGIEGDLETIVGKAMDKDRDRRYQSASELLQDIHRFIENEPIHARRASVAYQLKLFAKRNRGVVATVLTIAVALVLATIVSVYSSIRASQAEANAIVDRDRAVAAEQAVTSERDRAVAAEQTATVDRDRAVAAEKAVKAALVTAEESQKRTEKALAETQEITQWMLMIADSYQELLAMGAPRNAQGETLSVHDILLVASSQIDEKYGHEPHLEAPSRAQIGTLLWELGDLENARKELKRSIDLFNGLVNEGRVEELFQASVTYSNVLFDVGEHEKAKKMILQIIEGGTEVLAEGSASAVVLQAKTLLGDIMEIALEDFDETRALRREVIAVIDEGAKVSREFELDARVKLADTLMSSHALSGLKVSTEPLWKEATSMITELLPIAEEELGTMHPVLVDARIALSTDYFFSGQVMESIALVEQCYEDAKKIYGLKHLETARAAATLGGYMAMVQHPYTETVIKEAIATYKSIVGDSHPMLIMSKSSLGQFYARDERYAEAETVLREAVELSKRSALGDIYRLQASASLGYALLMQGKFDEAEPLWQEATDSIVESMGIDSPAYGSMQYSRAFGYVLNDHPDADETVDDFLAFALKTHGTNHSHVQLLATKLCFAYFDTGKYERGSTIMTDLINEVRGDPSSTDEELSNVLELESKLVGKYVENSYSPAVAIEILNRIIPELQKQWEPTSIEMVWLEVMRSQALRQLGQNEKSVTLFAALHKRVVDSLGHKDSITEMVAVQRTNNLIFLDRWSEADELVQENFNRNYSDADYLMEWAKNVVTNGHDGYRDRYLGLALEATERAVSIRGEDNPDATYRLAGVHAARGEYEEALNWMTKTIAFAGEDHEKIEKFREKLDQLNTLIKTGTLDIQLETYEDSD